MYIDEWSGGSSDAQTERRVLPMHSSLAPVCSSCVAFTSVARATMKSVGRESIDKATGDSGARPGIVVVEFHVEKKGN